VASFAAAIAVAAAGALQQIESNHTQDFANPHNEGVVGVMYDHHGDQDNFKPGDGNIEQRGDRLGLVARLESGPNRPANMRRRRP
jgi:hypothetical protein